MKIKTMLFATAFLLSVSFNGLNAQTDEQIVKELLFDLFDENFAGFCGDTIIMNIFIRRTHLEYDSVSSLGCGCAAVRLSR